MMSAEIERNQVDTVLLGWTLVWSSVASLGIVVFVNAEWPVDLGESAQIVLGIAMGGAVAAWTLLATWSILIHLPAESVADDAVADDAVQVRRERIAPRVAVLLILLVQFTLFAFGLGDARHILAEIVPSVVLGVAGAALAFQWTRQRIHRGMVVQKNRRSISQILGATTTVALTLALLKGVENWFSVSNHLLITIATISFFWMLMLWLSLGRFWWFALATIPIAGLVWGIITVTVDAESRDVEAVWMRSTGFVLGFYFLAMTLLLLMRSSGHRWFANRSFAARTK